MYQQKFFKKKRHGMDVYYTIIFWMKLGLFLMVQKFGLKLVWGAILFSSPYFHFFTLHTKYILPQNAQFKNTSLTSWAGKNSVIDHCISFNLIICTDLNTGPIPNTYKS